MFPVLLGLKNLVMIDVRGKVIDAAHRLQSALTNYHQ